MSPESLKTMWSSTLNPPLRDGEVPEFKVLFSVDDNYCIVDSDNLIVFDSSDSSTHASTIMSILERKEILETTLLDKFLGIEVEVILSPPPRTEESKSQVNNQAHPLDAHF